MEENSMRSLWMSKREQKLAELDALAETILNPPRKNVLLIEIHDTIEKMLQ